MAKIKLYIRPNPSVPGLVDVRYRRDVVARWSAATGELRIATTDGGQVGEAVISFAREKDMRKFVRGELAPEGALLAYSHGSGAIHMFDYNEISGYGRISMRTADNLPNDICEHIAVKGRRHRFTVKDVGDGMRHVRFKGKPLAWLWQTPDGECKLTATSIYNDLLYENSEVLADASAAKAKIDELAKCGIISYRRFGRQLYFFENDDVDWRLRDEECISHDTDNPANLFETVAA